MQYPTKNPNVMASTAVLDVLAAAIIWFVTGYDNEVWAIIGIGFFVIGIIRFVTYLAMLEQRKTHDGFPHQSHPD